MGKSSGIGAFILGGVIGAGLGLLFAPRPGYETRECLTDKALEFWDQADELYENGRERATDAYYAGRDMTTEAYYTGRERAAEAADQVREKIDEARERLFEAVSAANDEVAEDLGGTEEESMPSAPTEAGEKIVDVPASVSSQPAM